MHEAGVLAGYSGVPCKRHYTPSGQSEEMSGVSQELPEEVRQIQKAEMGKFRNQWLNEYYERRDAAKTTGGLERQEEENEEAFQE